MQSKNMKYNFRKLTMTVIITPTKNTLADWREIYWGAEFSLSPSANAGINSCAKAVQEIIDRNEPVYGINTGFGKLASVRINDEDLANLQRNLILSHSVGVGEYLPASIVRVVAAIKVASLCQGSSGARLETIQLMIELMKENLIPAIPAQGSVGASGDLAPLAHFVAAMMGEGDFLVDGKAVPAEPLLRERRLKPLVLAPKEGLALINGTQVSTALALAGLFEIERAFDASLITGAMSLEGFKGTNVPFDPRIHALRPHQGQTDVAKAMLALTENSEIREKHQNKTRVQDPYSFRCIPQVLGSCLDAMRHAASILEIEAQSVSDNPLIFANGDVLSGGNFHAEPVGFAADYLALAAAEIGSISERRTSLLLDPSISELPAFLTEKPGLNTGLMMGQITQAALVSENKQKATPAVVDTVPTSANQEDHVSMATHGARRLLYMAENTQNIIAIELMTAAQACDFHAPLKASPEIEKARLLLREQVPHLDEDRRQGPEISAARELVRSGKLVAVLEEGRLPKI